MYIFQNALRNVLRNRGRNILLGAIVFAVIVTSVIALMISNTADSIINDYKSRFGAEVRLSVNTQKLRDEAMANSTDGRVMITMPSIPSEQYIAFGESEYLQSAVYSGQTGVNCDSITSIDAEKGAGSGMMIMGGGRATESEWEPMQFMLNLLGNKFEEFETGTRTLEEGNFPENINECMVSTELAEENGIQIGDKFSFYGEVSNRMEGTRADISYELTVVGIYYDLTDEYTEGMMQNSFSNRRNEILTTYDTIAAQIVPEMNGIRLEAKYYLKEPGMLDAFAAEVYAKGLSASFDVTTDKASYNKIVAPVEGLKGIAVTFMIVVLVFGGIILALLSSIAIRERKYEIGVLRAMGMKKIKVALGLWSEMIMITGVCLLFGLLAGRIAAQPVTDMLLADQVEAAQAAESIQNNSGMGGMGMMTQGFGQGAGQQAANAEPLSELAISLSADTVLQIAGLALLLASLAAFASISKITKYEPIKILMERN